MVKRRRDFRGPSFCPLFSSCYWQSFSDARAFQRRRRQGFLCLEFRAFADPQHASYILQMILCVNQCFAFWIKRMFCAHVVCECCRGIPVFKAFLAIQSTRFCYASLDVGGSFQTPLLPLPDILLPSRFPEVNFFLFRLLGCTFRSNDCWSADVLTF